MSDYSACDVCIGVSVAALGLYITTVLPLVLTVDIPNQVILTPGTVAMAIESVVTIVALGAAFPYLVKLILYYGWRPEIHILYFDGDLDIQNKSGRMVELSIEYDFYSGDEVSGRSNQVMNKLMTRKLSNTRGTASDIGWIAITGPEITASPNSHAAIPVGLKPPMKLRVRVYPNIQLSAFGFPRFYGDVDLKPVERTISFDDAGNINETNNEWTESEFQTTIPWR